MKNTWKLIGLLAVLLTANAPLFAQPDLPSEEVEVIKDFEAILEETERVDVKPELPPADTTARRLTYDIPSKTVEVNYLPPSIRPIATRGEPLPPVYNGYLKLGYGIPSSPYAELAYQHRDADKYKLGGHLLHHSANYNSLENQRFSYTMGEVDGTYYFPQGYAVGGKLGYTSDVVHYYGYDHDELDYTRDEVEQHFNTFDAKINFFNGERTQGDINYNASLDFYMLNDNFSNKERGALFDFGLTKYFNDIHPLKLRIATDFNHFEDTATQDLNNFFLQPSFTYHADAFKIRIGGNLTSHRDSFKIFPDIEASVNIAGNKLAAFAGAGGDLQKNTLRVLSDYNPWINPRFDLRNTSFYDFYGGVRGNVKIVQYQAQVGLKKTKDLPLYLTSPFFSEPIDTLRFNVLYDDVNIFYIKGTVDLQPVEGLQLLLTVSQNIYSLEREEKAWHLPSLELNTTAIYTTMEDKLRLKADIFVQDGVPFADLDNNIGELNALFDVNLGAEYAVTKNFGIFFNLNNLASNKRQRWRNYPTYGLNLLGGLTARF